MAWLAAPVVSLLILGAHVFRAGSYVLLGLVFAVLALLAVRRRWAVRVVQTVLLLGAFEWLMTLGELAFWRGAAGQPFGRLVVILLAVALFTAASAFAFRAPALRRFYRMSVGAASTGPTRPRLPAC
jgi:hypothetical protein